MRTIPLLTALGLSLAPALWAQQPPPSAAPAVKTYAAKYEPPGVLAASLSSLFPSGVSAVAARAGNAVVISGSPDYVERAMQALEALDQRTAVVAVEVAFVDGGEGVDPKALTGPAAEVMAKLEGMKHKGTIAGLRRVRVDGTEGVAAVKQAGEERSVVMGSSVTARGLVSNSVDRRRLGTLVDVVPRVAPDGRIALELKIDDARLMPTEAPDTPGVMTTESFKGTVSVTPGQAAVVSAASEDGKARRQTIFVVFARVVEPQGK
ncbi:MAG: secretin N-terminal domain-containing protein [Gemmataceae bacterium]